MMAALKYVEGDATQPQGDGLKVVAHVCNDLGLWGSGFVLAVSDRWKLPEAAYRSINKYVLGQTQFVPVANDILVANMIAQDGRPSKNRRVVIDYVALERCLLQIWSHHHGASVHMPRIGCGIAGGDWETVAEIIEKTLAGMSVTVYDLPGQPFKG